MRQASNKPGRTRLALLAAAPLALALTLAACDNNDDDDGPVAPPTTAPPTTPAPTPTPTQASRNVSACISQVILPATANSAAVTPATLVLPDTLKLDFNRPNGFPNGRQFDDPVIDLELAALLLDLTRHPVTSLIGVLNPAPPSDNATTGTFPFLKAANGGQPAPGTATTFDFRPELDTFYVRVDRMGNPAIATALIGSPLKNPFNDADPADDVTGIFVNAPNGVVATLTGLHNALIDDLTAARLTPCSTPG
jgi:hypothetical protein